MHTFCANSMLLRQSLKAKFVQKFQGTALTPNIFCKSFAQLRQASQHPDTEANTMTNQMNSEEGEDFDAFVKEVDRLLLDKRKSEKVLRGLIRERATFHSRDLPRVQVLYCSSFGGYGTSKAFELFVRSKLESEVGWTDGRTVGPGGDVRSAMRQFALWVFQIQKPGIAALERALIAFFTLRLADVVDMAKSLARDKFNRDKVAVRLDLLRRHLIDTAASEISNVERETSQTEVVDSSTGVETGEEGSDLESLNMNFYRSLSEKDLERYTVKQVQRMEVLLTERLRRLDADEPDPTLCAQFAQKVPKWLPFVPSAEEMDTLLSTLLKEYAATAECRRSKEMDMFAPDKECFLDHLLDTGKMEWSWHSSFLGKDSGRFAEHISDNRGKHDILARCLEHASLHHLIAQQTVEVTDMYHVNDRDMEHDPLVYIGRMLASDQCCTLSIAHVPALVDYEILEYDGKETVAYE